MQLPDPNSLIAENLSLWVRYHSPLSGSLGIYQSLLLSDVLRVYALGHQSFGMMLFNNQQYNLAENEFKDAINYLPDNIDNYIQLSQVYLKTQSCEKAEKTLENTQSIDQTNLDVNKFFIDVYANCFHNNDKATIYAELYKKYDALKNK